MDEVDVVVIGGGSGGYVAAVRAAQLGARVALVEKDRLGGTCLNRGCIPTKALARSVEVLLEAMKAGDFGIVVGNISLDFSRVMARKDRVVAQLVAGVEQLMKSNRIAVHNGTARILSPHLVAVGDASLTTRKIIVATGSQPARLPVPGIDLPGVLTTDGILDLKELPRSLAIIGGGYVGVEMASIFNALGTAVTIVEQLPLLLATVDGEISRRLARTLARRGIAIKTEARVKEIRQERDALRVAWDMPQGEGHVDSQAVLLAAGRVPCTDGLGLVEMGIAMAGRAVAVNERLETSIPDIYAVGDVVGKTMLAHVASYEGEIAAENALGKSRLADYRVVPGCIFTRPEIGSAGMTEEQAKDSGIPYRVSKFPFAASGRAVAMDETDGLVKMVCHAEDGRVLGMHIMGPHATDLIAEGVLAIKLGATADDIAGAIHAHPTLPEAVREAALGQSDASIHFGKV